MSPLGGRPVLACSVSDPPETDLVARGLGKEHLDLVFIEVARNAIALGWDLAYGGALRGFTDQLYELEVAYRRSDVDPDLTSRIHSYLASYIFDTVDASKMAAAKNVATVQRVVPVLPEGVDPVDRLGRSLGLSVMREEVTRRTRASVVVGGRVLGAQGAAPGVLEEAWCSLQAEQPLFVLGGFGGASSLIADRLVGGLDAERRLPELLRQLDGDDGYNGVNRDRVAHGLEPRQARTMVEDFGAAGIDGLRNGLSPEQNLVLLTSDDVEDVVSTIRAGLVGLGTGATG